jgi:hypothetical protein
MTTPTPPAVYVRHREYLHSAIASADEPSETLATPVPRPILAFKNALGDHCDRRTLSRRLQTVIQQLPGQLVPDDTLTPAKARERMETALASLLSSTTMYVCEDASYQPPQPLPPNRLVSLDAYLQGCALQVPKTLEALVELKNALSAQAQAHPLGNLGGALSWPRAMPGEDQNTLVHLLHSNETGLQSLPLPEGGKGALGYLLSGSSVVEADLKHPMVAMEKLLASPKARALEQALRARLGGMPAVGCNSDYVMTAIQLGLDPESLAAPARNHVAGFDLASSQYWGQPASTVVEALGKHLIEQGRVSATTAHLGAYLLLAKAAPHYLVKDIPQSVTYGSVLWAQLTMAVARIEVQTPGRTLAMGYAEILLAAEQLDSDETVSQPIDYQALRDWGIASGFLVGAEQVPSASDMERVRTAYNHHLSSLKDASTLLQTDIPSRKAMALTQLKAAFPDLDSHLFEVRTLHKARLKEGRPGLYPGERSMLDVVMEGGALGPEDHWISTDKRLPVQRFCALYEKGGLGVAAPFQASYDEALSALEDGQQRLVRHLISTLPLEDRRNLEEGKLEFFHTNQYTIAGDLLTPPALHVRGHTLEVKTTTRDGPNLYTIDTRRGVIEKENFLLRRRTEPYTTRKMEQREANILSRTAVFDPYDGKRAAHYAQQPQGTGQPDSFNSPRSQLIADVFVKSLDLNNADLLQEARGVTSYDQDRSRNHAISEFFLNLIPLRSAIVNFQNGSVGQGLFDLGMDVVGLVTLGAGKAAQAGKALGKTLSTASRLAKAARFVGATVVEAFNPLSGLGDLALVGGRLALRGGRTVVNHLKGATGSYDLLKIASKQYGDVATGSFKVAGERVEGAATLHNGKWYALDAQAMRPYGRPLEDFVPAARAVEGKVTLLPKAPDAELSNALFGSFNVPEARIAGCPRNSQGVYVAADGHVSHIRHTDSTGRTAVYEVRQVTRTEDGRVQARVYHNNRQTSLLVEHVQGDQWQRLGARGGSPASVKADLGREIGRGTEGVVYESLDGRSAYKDMGATSSDVLPDYTRHETRALNQYYGEGFATAILEDGRSYIKMPKLDGVSMAKIEKRSLPPEVRTLLEDALNGMEAKGVYHQDLQLKNLLYSSRDNKIYPVDIQSLPPELMVPGEALYEMEIAAYTRSKNDLKRRLSELLA